MSDLVEKTAETFAIESSTPAVVSIPAETVYSPEYQQLDLMFKQVTTLLTPMLRRGEISAGSQKQLASLYTSIVSLVTRVGTTELFDLVHKFLVDNKNGVAQKNKLLAGSKYLTFVDARRVAIFFHVFRTIDDPDHLTVRLDAVTAILKCPTLITYLRQYGVRMGDNIPR